jgi:hypothetical protein
LMPILDMPSWAGDEILTRSLFHLLSPIDYWHGDSAYTAKAFCR